MKKFYVFVQVNPSQELRELYPLAAQLRDTESSLPLDQEVGFKDMGHVRSYYNGMLAAWGLSNGYRHGVELTSRGSVERKTAVYENPVNIIYKMSAVLMAKE